MKTFLKVALGVMVGGLLLVGGCVALIGAGVDEADDEAEETAITKAQFEAVEVGSTEAEVRKELGGEDDRQQFGGKRAGESCLYYGQKGEGIAGTSSYQFCFEGGELRSKNAY